MFISLEVATCCVCTYTMYLLPKYLNDFIWAQAANSLDVPPHLLNILFANNC